MHKITKVFLIVVSLLGLIEALWFTALRYPLGVVSRIARTKSIPEPWLGYFGLVLGVLVGLTFLWLLFYACLTPPAKKDLQLKTAQGNLHISRHALEKTLRFAISEQHPVENVAVDIKLTGRSNASAFVEAATAVTDLNSLGQSIEKTTTEQLSQRLEIPIKKVVVKLQPTLTKSANRTSRVI